MNKNKGEKMQKINMKINTFFLLYIIIIVNHIFAEAIFNQDRKLQKIMSMNLKVISGEKIKIIKKDFLPDRIYINGIESTINKYGYISTTSYGNYIINNVTIEWDKKKSKYEKIFQDIDTIIEIDLSNFDTSGLNSMKNMFINCYKLQYINFTDVDTSLVTTMESMFENCTSLTSIDLSSFVTTKVENMNNMFKNCKSLTSLNLTNFNSKLKKMKEMFYGCSSLTNLFIPNIDTSSVTNMDRIFYECYELISLDISNFETKKVKSMMEMFFNCKSLKSIDLSKIDTSSVTNMFRIFYSCSSLISLDLSNFHLSKQNLEGFFFGCGSLTSIKFSTDLKNVSYISRMFESCSSLKSIDLSSFNLSSINSMEYLFSGCSSLISLDLSNINILSPINMIFTFGFCRSLKEINFTNFKVFPTIINAMFFECNSLISLDLSGFNTSFTNDMAYTFYNCHKLISINLSNFNTSLVENMDYMFFGCFSLISLELSSFDTSNVIFMNSMFESCSELRTLDLSYFNSEKVENMNFMFSNCINLRYINFYNYSNECSPTTKDIFFSTPDTLIICIKDGSPILSYLSPRQCIINDCSKKINNFHKLTYDNRICLNDCEDDKIYNYQYNDDYCYDKCPKGTHSNKNNIHLCQMNEYECFEDYPFLIIEYNTCTAECNGKDFFNDICTLNNLDNITQSILIESIKKAVEEGLMDDLIEDIINKEKHDIIKKRYNILYQITSAYNQNNNEYKNLSTIKLGELENIIKDKYNISINESLIIFKIEKYIEGILIPLIEYEIFNPETKEIIDLKNFQNINLNIIISIPISIKENILYKYDPNNRYYNDICYTYTTERGTDLTLFDRQNEFNKENYSFCFKNCLYSGYDLVNKKVICECRIEGLLINNSYDFLNKFEISMKATNFYILKCYKLLFSKEGLIKNFFNYIILLIIILYIAASIYFYRKGLDFIWDEINEVIENKTLESKYDINSKKVEKEISKDNSTAVFSSQKNQTEKTLKKNIYNSTINYNDSKSELQNKIKSFLINKSAKQEIKKDNENEKSIEYIEIEINSFKFEDAVENDRRTYFQFYISLIKEKHILFFTFYKNKDYNSQIIKVCFLFFSLSIFLVVNAFFFNDLILHRIYYDYGKFNFIYILPQILYSIIITSIINEILKKISLSHPNILGIKNESNKYNLEGKILTELKRIIIKFTCFFIFGIIFLIIFWYYLSCFCAVFKNTQIYFIKTIIIGYILSLIYPFIYFLLPGIFRIPAIKFSGICFYKISQILLFL